MQSLGIHRVSSKRLQSPKYVPVTVNYDKDLKNGYFKEKTLASLSFTVNPILSKLSNPACISSSFGGFVICFGFGVCVCGGGGVT